MAILIILSGKYQGKRLALPAGQYVIAVEMQELSDAPPPVLEIVPEGRFPAPRPPRTEAFRRDAPGRLGHDFAVSPDERGVTLRIRGGGPGLLRRIVLRAQP